MVTAEKLRKLLSYDPETGVFTRLSEPSDKIKIGDIAGSKNSRGYISICIDYKRHYAHRLAWLYMTGFWPKQHIYHIDGQPSNNIFANLRDIPNAGNRQNRKSSDRDNACGLLGVRKMKTRFHARIRVDGVQHHLGAFRTSEEAHAAYLAAKRKMHPFGTL